MSKIKDITKKRYPTISDFHFEDEKKKEDVCENVTKCHEKQYM